MMICSQPLTFEILRSVDSGVAPHHRSPTSATEPAGQDLWASSLPERATVPLQSQANASPFLIMFLLSSGKFEREIIEGTPHVLDDVACRPASVIRSVATSMRFGPAFTSCSGAACMTA